MAVLAQQSNATLGWIALALAGLALVAAAAVTVVALGRRGAAAPPAAANGSASVTRLLNRSEEQLRTLQGRLQTCETERRRLERLRSLASSVELPDLASRLLDELAALRGADAATVILTRRSGAPLVVSRGELSFALGNETLGIQPLVPPGAAVAEIAYRNPEAEGVSPRVGGSLVAPLRRDDGEELGYLCVHWQGAAAPPAELQDELTALARNASGTVRTTQRIVELSEAAARDPLTSLYNRRFFHEELARQVARARRYRRPLGLMMLDIDDFKAINARVGHLEADAVLGEVAARIALCVRSADVPSRIGGDEFAVILPEATEDDALRLYHRIRGAMGDAPALTRVEVTVSAGVADFRGDDARTLFNRAEVALRQAKGAGKANVAVAPDALPDDGVDLDLDGDAA